MKKVFKMTQKKHEKILKSIGADKKQEPASHTPVLKLTCGCFTTGKKNEVVQCPLHATAPELLEACKEALERIQGLDTPWMNTDMLESAIAKSEGK